MWFTYLLVDFFCILFPLLFSFHPKIKFYTQWRFMALPALATATFFIVWDILFTHLNVWAFNPNYICGIYVFNLPIEEVLFFFCIPYACVFTYYCVNKFLKIAPPQKLFFSASSILIAILLTVALLNISLLYTSVTFLLTSLLLLVLFLKRAPYLKVFMISFLFILIPFFISNGILTGSFLNEPVVIYNKVYNLGFRMFTIPVEDTFYGMLLLLMNVSGYEMLKKRSLSKP